MYDKRNQLAHQVVNEVHRNFPGRVFDAVIPRMVSLAEAPSFGKQFCNLTRPKAARAYRQLAEEVIKYSN